MAGYVPCHAKKRERREHLAAALRRLLGDGAPPDEVARAAQAVRQARLRELGARAAQLLQTPQHAAERAAIEQQITTWRTMPLDAVVDHRRRCANRT